MKKSIKRFIVFAWLLVACVQSAWGQEAQKNSASEAKKKIVVVWSKGGGAHKTMLKSLIEQFGHEYDIVPLNPFEIIWKMSDMACGPFSNMVSEFYLPIDGRTVCDYVRKRDMKSAIAAGAEYLKFLLANRKSVEVTGAIWKHRDEALSVLNRLTAIFDELDEDDGVNQKDGESFYNELLRNDKTAIINYLHKNQLHDIAQNAPEIQQRFEKYFEAEKPDLVISLIPFFNNAMLEASHAVEVPFLLLPPDFDIGNYFYSKTPQVPETWERSQSWREIKVAQPAPQHDFACFLPFNASLINEKARDAGILQQVKGYGFPLRADFFKVKDVGAIKREFNIPVDKKVIMILMGGAGSAKVIEYVTRLATGCVGPVHILACVGNDSKMADRLDGLKNFMSFGDVTMSVVRYTEKISDLMAVADLLITKPGPTTLCEAIQMKLPLIIDATTISLEWEESHIEFVGKYKLGAVMKPEENFGELCAQVLSDRENIRARMGVFAEGTKNFSSQLTDLIAKLIVDGSRSRASVGSLLKMARKQLTGSALLSASGIVGYLVYRRLHNA